MNSVFLYIETILYLVCIVFVATKILDNRIKRRGFLIFAGVLLGPLAMIAYFYNDSVFLLLCGAVQIVQLVLISFSFKKNKLLSVFGTYVFINGINMIPTVCARSLFSLPNFQMQLFEFGFSLLIIGFCLYCCFKPSLNIKIREMLNSIPTKIKALSVSLFFISLEVMLLLVSYPEIQSDTPWGQTVRISIVFFSLFVCTTFPILLITVLTNTYLKKQNESFDRELQAQAKHYMALSKSNEELRRFRHDFKNLRIGMVRLINSGDTELALDMLAEGQKSFLDATEKLIKFETGNGIVDAILSEKQSKSASINTNIRFHGAMPPEIFPASDLCVIFGNTLDNAVEACAKLPNDEEKTISVSVQCSAGFAFISITNPVAERVKVFNNTVETTKKDTANHGYGLSSLRKIAKKYDGEMTLIAEETRFTVNLDLTIPRK